MSSLISIGVFGLGVALDSTSIKNSKRRRDLIHQHVRSAARCLTNPFEDPAFDSDARKKSEISMHSRNLSRRSQFPK